MALPSSGQLSINQIRNEIGTSNGSLRYLSSLAGFSTPDAISDFYGYSNVVTLYMDYSLPSYATCYNYYIFGANVSNFTNVSTDVQVTIYWYGDLGGYMYGTVVIYAGTSCNTVNIYSGGGVNCWGENFSYAFIPATGIYPSSYGNQTYQPGNQLTYYPC